MVSYYVVRQADLCESQGQPYLHSEFSVQLGLHSFFVLFLIIMLNYVYVCVWICAHEY